MTRRLARSQEIPEYEARYILSLSDVDLHNRVADLYDAGWTLQSIGNIFYPVRRRSTIKSWVDRARLLRKIDVHTSTTDVLKRPVPLPQYKTDPRGYQRLTPKSPGVPNDVKERLRELAPTAQLYRARMPSSSSPAQANQEMDEIVRSLRDYDVSIADIARAANVTHRAIAKRIERLTGK